MRGEPFTLIDGARPVAVSATVTGDAVRLSGEAVGAALGWEIRPEGLCRDGVCRPFPPDAAPVGDGIDLARLAALLDRPLALDAAERAACLGVSAGERQAGLASLRAPDFSLPDLEGRLHSLGEQRGRKVLLVFYASW